MTTQTTSGRALTRSSTRDHILDVAERLIQLQGCHGFSFRDVATEVDVKTSSVHYHFPTKADLVAAVVERHISLLLQGISEIAERPGQTPRAALDAMLRFLVTHTYDAEHRMCLGGMLAAEILGLAPVVQEAVRGFFAQLESGLRGFLAAALAAPSAAQSRETAADPGLAGTLAEQIIQGFEGALLLARLHGDRDRLERFIARTVARAPIS